MHCVNIPLKHCFVSVYVTMAYKRLWIDYKLFCRFIKKAFVLICCNDSTAHSSATNSHTHSLNNLHICANRLILKHCTIYLFSLDAKSLLALLLISIHYVNTYSLAAAAFHFFCFSICLTREEFITFRSTCEMSRSSVWSDLLLLLGLIING